MKKMNFIFFSRNDSSQSSEQNDRKWEFWLFFLLLIDTKIFVTTIVNQTSHGLSCFKRTRENILHLIIEHHNTLVFQVEFFFTFHSQKLIYVNVEVDS